MGVHQSVVVPTLVTSHTSLVELTDCYNRVLGLSIDGVAVNIKLTRECVVLLELLQLSKRGTHKCRVNNSDTCCGLSIRT